MPDVEEDSVRRIVSAFKQLGQIPTVKSAEATRHDVRIVLSSRSFTSLARQTSHATLVLPDRQASTDDTLPHARWVSSDRFVDTSDDPIKAEFAQHPLSSANDTSDTPPKRVILRETEGKAGAKRTVELWKGCCLLQSITVGDRHGSFVTNDLYASFSLHGNRVLYSAQSKGAVKVAEMDHRQKESEHADGLEAYEFKPPLGSLFNGQRYPSVFLLDFDCETLHRLDSSTTVGVTGTEAWGSETILAQATFDASGQHILLTAYPPLHDGRRLGLAACTNRPSVILRLPAFPEDKDVVQCANPSSSPDSEKPKPLVHTWSPSAWDRLSSVGQSARGATIADQNACIWLECESEGEHNDCNTLMSWSPAASTAAAASKVEVAIKQVSDTPTSWPGLFCNLARRNCSLSHSSSIALTTIWGSRQTIVLHRIGSNSDPVDVTPVGLDVGSAGVEKNDKVAWSYVLHCTDGFDSLFATRSNPTCPSEFLCGQVKDNGQHVIWTRVRKLSEEWNTTCVLKDVNDMETSIISVPSTSMDDTVDSIVMQPKKTAQKGKLPCIVVMHGGPHSTSTIDFSPSLATLCAAGGFCIIQPNYHGSLGRGQTFAHSLTGRCGRLDVDDCHAAVLHAVKRFNLDPSQIFADGGSHGGFLSLHLVGQFPSTYRASIVRNPVTSVQLMDFTNDIPDWLYAEFGLPFHFSRPPQCLSTAQFDVLTNASPLRYIDNIQAPVLLLVGQDDLRVAPSQSKVVFHALRLRERQAGKQANSMVRMLTFDGQGHPLDGVEAELVSFEARVRWIEKHRT